MKSDKYLHFLNLNTLQLFVMNIFVPFIILGSD